MHGSRAGQRTADCYFTFMSDLQTNESFAALFEESIARSNMKAGEVI